MTFVSATFRREIQKNLEFSKTLDGGHIDNIHLLHRAGNLADKHLDGIRVGGRRVRLHLAHHGQAGLLARTAHHLHRSQFPRLLEESLIAKVQQSAHWITFQHLLWIFVVLQSWWTQLFDSSSL